MGNFDNCEISENLATGSVRILKFELLLHLSSSAPLERYTFALVFVCRDSAEDWRTCKFEPVLHLSSSAPLEC